MLARALRAESFPAGGSVALDAAAVNEAAAGMADSSAASRRIGQADGLRAFACLLVVWQHVSEVYKIVASGGLWLSQIADTVDFGRIGVCAFFAISGFVVPTSIRGPRLQGVLDFAERRFWRLYPPYWFSIPFGVLAVWVIWGKDLSLSMVVANSTMAPSLWGEPFAMGHYWTLEVELAFYCLCGLVYLVFGRISLALSLACVVLAFLARRYKLLAGTPDHWPFAALDLAIMFWGCCCRLIFDGALPAWLGKYRRALGGILITASLAVVLWEPLNFLWIGYARDLAGHRRLGWGYSLGVSLFVFWVLVAQIRIRFLEWMGKGTYSIYLLHPVVFYVAFKLVRGGALASLEGLHLGAYLALLVPLCAAVGMVAYHLVERPSDILRRVIAANARSPKQQPARSATVVNRCKRFSSTMRVNHSLHRRRLVRPGSRSKRHPAQLGQARTAG
jgi:peptidoglycan/LPS O-acetylase OafA/YrhL